MLKKNKQNIHIALKEYLQEFLKVRIARLKTAYIPVKFCSF